MSAGYDLLADTLVQRDAEIARLTAEVAKLRAALEADLEDIVEYLRNPPEEVIEIGADECHCPIEVMKSAWSLMACRILEKIGR